MLSLHDKLNRLSRMEDMAIFRWSAGTQRIAGDFILLSNLRLNTLSCNGGRIVYSEAAPTVYSYHGRPSITWHDRGLLTVITGGRAGINIKAHSFRDDEECAETRFCEWRLVDEEHCPKWLENKIRSMCSDVVYPTASVRMPDVYRISKKPETLRPIFTKALIDAIGGSREDSSEVLMQKFRANFELFAHKTNDGYVIPGDYICAGGCCVVRAKGIPANGGSIKFSIPLRSFVAECSRSHWEIATALTIPTEEEKEE